MAASRRTITEARQQEHQAWDKVIDQLIVVPYNLPESAKTDEYFVGFYGAITTLREALPGWARRELLKRQKLVDPAFQDVP